MQRGAHDELAQVAAGGDALELGHALARVGRRVGDRHAGERLQAVRVHPDVGAADPHGAVGAVAQPGERRRALARRLVHEPARAGGDRLPAGVADPAAERERVVEQRDRVVEVALAQRELGPQRLGEGLERHPALLGHQRERVVEQLDGLRQLPAQHQRAPEDGQRERRLADVAAAPRRRDRLAEQPDRRLVVRAVGQRLAAHAEDGGALAVVLRQAAGPRQPAAGGDPARRLAGDEAELAADLALDLAVAARLRERERLVQHRGALLVAAADRVHERGAERRQRPRAAAPGRRPRAPPRTPGAGTRSRRRRRRRRPPGGPASSCPTAAARSPAGGALLGVGRTAHARIGLAPELAPEQRLAGVGVIARGAGLARPRQTAHEQLVGAVVEAVELDRARRQARRPRAGRRPRALASAASLSTASHRPAKRRRSTAARRRSRARRPGSTPSSSSPRTSSGSGSPAASASTSIVASAQPQLERVAAQRLRLAERAAQLRQRPAQRPARVVGVAEDQAGQPRARDRPLGQRQIREHRPRLVPARRGDGHVVALDLRRSQQADRERRHRTMLTGVRARNCGIEGGGVAGSGRASTPWRLHIAIRRQLATDHRRGRPRRLPTRRS